MQFYCDAWNGPVSCALPLRDAPFPFGKTYEYGELPFSIQLISKQAPLGPGDLRDFDLVLCCGDNHEYFYLAEICKSLSVKIIYSIECTLETRMQIAMLDQSKNFLRKIYSVLWILNSERQRRRAFKIADGLQANGYPAHKAYKPFNCNTHFYLDSRIDAAMLASEEDMAARRAYLSSMGPIRLLHSGRLEPIKGAQDLIPVAQALARNNLDFELNIFGTGSLEAVIRRDIERAGLSNRVHFHGAVDFETELVPFARSNADVFLSCHRQSDPSCTYIESMGCGLAIAGYSNRMWAALNHDSNAGWSAPLGNIDALAGALLKAAANREDLIARCDNAWAFARSRAFEREFSQRIRHLTRVLDEAAPNSTQLAQPGTFAKEKV